MNFAVSRLVRLEKVSFLSFANYQVNFQISSLIFGLLNDKHKNNHDQRNNYSYQLFVSICKKKNTLPIHVQQYLL